MALGTGAAALISALAVSVTVYAVPGRHLPSQAPRPLLTQSAGWRFQGGRWWYAEEQGGWASSGWREIDGEWYLFDADGWMLTGWQYDGSNWYYLQPTGEMATGWVHDGNAWYYLNDGHASGPSGAMQTGWLFEGGSWYFMDRSGAMNTGWVEVDGATYHLGDSGAMDTGWICDDAGWHYLHPDGSEARGEDTPDGGHVDGDGVWHEPGDTNYSDEPTPKGDASVPSTIPDGQEQADPEAHSGDQAEPSGPAGGEASTPGNPEAPSEDSSAGEGDPARPGAEVDEPNEPAPAPSKPSLPSWYFNGPTSPSSGANTPGHSQDDSGETPGGEGNDPEEGGQQDVPSDGGDPDPLADDVISPSDQDPTSPAGTQPDWAHSLHDFSSDTKRVTSAQRLTEARPDAGKVVVDWEHLYGHYLGVEYYGDAPLLRVSGADGTRPVTLSATFVKEADPLITLSGTKIPHATAYWSSSDIAGAFDKADPAPTPLSTAADGDADASAHESVASAVKPTTYQLTLTGATLGDVKACSVRVIGKAQVATQISSLDGVSYVLGLEQLRDKDGATVEYALHEGNLNTSGQDVRHGNTYTVDFDRKAHRFVVDWGNSGLADKFDVSYYLNEDQLHSHNKHERWGVETVGTYAMHALLTPKEGYVYTGDEPLELTGTVTIEPSAEFTSRRGDYVRTFAQIPDALRRGRLLNTRVNRLSAGGVTAISRSELREADIQGRKLLIHFKGTLPRITLTCIPLELGDYSWYGYASPVPVAYGTSRTTDEQAELLKHNKLGILVYKADGTLLTGDALKASGDANRTVFDDGEYIAEFDGAALQQAWEYEVYKKQLARDSSKDVWGADVSAEVVKSATEWLAMRDKANNPLTYFTHYVVGMLNEDPGSSTTVYEVALAGTDEGIKLANAESYGPVAHGASVASTRAVAAKTAADNASGSGISEPAKTMVKVSADAPEHRLQDDPSAVKNAWKIVDEIGQGYGTNLAGTMEANLRGGWSQADIDAETHWSRIRTTREMIHGLWEKGFRCIRIPVTWVQHLDAEHNIDRAWLARVHEIVDWCIDEGFYVIVNTHHEDWIERYGMDRATEQDEAKAVFLKVWNQIDAELGGYDQHLIYEGMNEPGAPYDSHDRRWEWPKDEDMRLINELNALLREYVRGSATVGGTTYTTASPYKACRPIMVTGHSAQRAQPVTSLLKVPTYDDNDSANDDPYVIVSVHNYAPYEFTLGDDPVEPTVFTPKRAAEVVESFEDIRSAFLDKGIPVIIGEAMPTYRNNNAARAEWIKLYASYAKTYGVPFMLWDGGCRDAEGENGSESHGLFDRRTLEWCEHGDGRDGSASVVAKLQEVWKGEGYVWASERIAPKHKTPGSDGAIVLSFGSSLQLDYDLAVAVENANLSGELKVSSGAGNGKSLSAVGGTITGTKVGGSETQSVETIALTGKEIVLSFKGEVPRLCLMNAVWEGWTEVKPTHVVYSHVDANTKLNEGLAYFSADGLKSAWSEPTYGAYARIRVKSYGQTTLVSAAVVDAPAVQQPGSSS